jgi:ribosome-binding factor A
MGRASEKRIARVRSLLLQTLADIVREELDDPRLQLVSFTDAKLARDLSSAQVKVVSIAGGEQAAEQCVAALESAKHIIWNRLRDETDLRKVPQLAFQVDRGPQYQNEIEQILRRIPAPDSDERDHDGKDTPDQPETEAEN